MKKLENLEGKQFGKLIAVERLRLFNKRRVDTYYRCKCECGNERIVLGYELNSGKVYACKECTKEMKAEKRRKDYTGQRFGRLVILEMLYNYGDDNKTYARCKCDCGNEKLVLIGNLLNGHTQSCGCLESESRYEREHYTDITGNRYGYLTAIKKTDSHASNGSVIWECRCDCGNITYVPYSNLSSNHTTSCGCKKSSLWEELIKKYLDDNNIQYDPEHRFEDCTNIQGTDMLPFDFYIEPMNLIIEYDGLQHYMPIEHWGGEEKFKTTQRNDNIKNEYCKSHNIDLIRIPYTMKKNEIIDLLNSIFVRNE